MNTNKEIWKDIKGYEGIYQISNLGRIRSIKGWNGHEYVKRVVTLKNSMQKVKENYSRSIIVLIKKKKRRTFKVHRLVAEHFLDNPNNYPVVNHIDGNPLNNNVENLEWCTQKYNVQHSIDLGNTTHRIRTIDRETMVELLNNGFNYDEIASILSIAKGTVFNYIRKFKIRKIYL